ncbi:MAG: TolC family protein [Candidatus Omnitrophota bacterium]
MKISHWWRYCLIVGFLSCLAGCSTQHYRESADREVYRILAEKGPSSAGSFDIEPKSPPAFPPDEITEVGLQEVLQLAALHSRDYQTRKENLYLQALSLTAQRHLYRPRFGAGLSAGWTSTDGTERVNLSGDFSLIQWLADGAQATLNLRTDFLRYLTGDPQESLGSLLRLNLLQPLFRGAGRRVARENLTQSERDVVYAIRSFLHYQRTFSVQITTNYYQLLERKMVLSNEENNYQQLVTNRQRSEMLGEAGRLPLFQVDQARQDELRAYERMITARTIYQEEIDQFKVLLGLPADAAIRFSDKEAEELTIRTLPVLQLSLAQALEISLQNRLDLMSALDAVEDASRKVAVSRDNLRAGLLFAGSVGMATPEDENTALNFDSDKTDYSAGLQLDLPVDRLTERNSYRQSLIYLERSRRNLSFVQDSVSLGIRTAWRNLEQARQSYENQKVSLELARRRVESINMLLDAGRASQRDLLEAQSASLQARNSLLAATVDYLSANLSFLRDAEMLEIGSNGVWTGDWDAQINAAVNN